MRWIGFLIGLAFFTSVTGAAVMASTAGWGLPGVLDKPVTVRQQSVRGGGYRTGGAFLYFGSRRHFGGGYGYGK